MPEIEQTPYRYNEHELKISIAVSLKRIADHQSETNRLLWVIVNEMELNRKEIKS